MSIDVQTFKNLFPDVAKHCDKDGLVALLASVSYQNVSASKVVIHEGDVSANLYFVIKGKLTTALQGEDELVVMGEMLAGDSFCKASLLDPGPAPMTVTAVDDSELLILTHNAFRELEKEHLSMTGNILRMLSDELIELCRNADRMLFNKNARATNEPVQNKGSSLKEWATNVYKRLHGQGEEK